MKIIAEFNSTEELLSFIGTFGNKATEYGCGTNTSVTIDGSKLSEVVPDTLSKKETKKPEVVGKEPKQEVPTVDAEKVGVDQEVTEVKDATELKEEPKVTKEQVRAVFAKLIQSGKQKEAKELTNKYGAKKLPDVKEEDYAAILKEAEELL